MTDDADDLYRHFGYSADPTPTPPKPTAAAAPEPEPAAVESSPAEPVEQSAADAVLAEAAAVVGAERDVWEAIAAEFGDDRSLLDWVESMLPSDFLLEMSPDDARRLLDVARVATNGGGDFGKIFTWWPMEHRVAAVALGPTAAARIDRQFVAATTALTEMGSSANLARDAVKRGPAATWKFIEAVRRRMDDAEKARIAAADAERERADAAADANRLRAEQDRLLAHYSDLIGLVMRADQKKRWYELLAAAGLAKTTETADTNPDGSRTVRRELAVPEVTGFTITRDSLVLEFRPQLGQTLAAFERGVASLGMALGYPQLSAEAGRPGYVQMRTRDRRVTLPPMVWRSRRDLPRGVSSRDEAAAAVDRLRLPIGVLASGESFFTPPLPKSCHTVVAGSVGSGKSVWVAETVAYLAGVGPTGAGAEVYVLDGKGSDYAGARPYVAAVAAKTWEHTVMLRHCYDVMMARTARADELITQGLSTEAAYAIFHPIILVIDEWGATRARMSKAIGKSKTDHALQYLDEIIRVGRQPRVWVILASQTMYDKDVPNIWQENLPNRLVIGQPEPMSISKVFDRNAPAALELAPSVEKTAKGRAIVQTSNTSVSLIQTFYDYAPGRDWGTSPDEDSWKIQAASLETPRLYPRRAPDLDQLLLRAGPTDDLAAIVADFIATGTQDDWTELRMIALDHRDESGRYVPNASQTHLDPAHPDYVGRVRSRINLDED